MLQELLTIDELSKVLKVKKSWIYTRTRIRTKDKIPALKVGKHYRFEEPAVIDWLKRQTESELEE